MEELAKLDEKIEDARKNYGDTEVRDAILEKAKYYKNKKDKEMARKVFMEAFAVAAGPIKKMDIIFEILLIATETQDLDLFKENIDKCKEILKEGGDWEHKNRLKVFEGIYSILIRDFKSAALLFIDCVSTFTSADIMPFRDLVFYAVLTSMVSLDRSTMRDKIIHCPEVLSEIRHVPFLKEFSDSLYNCEYNKYFECFGKLPYKYSGNN